MSNNSQYLGIEVSAHAAVRLPESSSFGAGKQDPYLVLQAGNSKNRTDPCKGGGRNPTWNQVVPLTISPNTETLQVAVWRASKMRRDELLGFGVTAVPCAAQLARGKLIDRVALKTPTGQSAGEAVLIFRPQKTGERRSSSFGPKAPQPVQSSGVGRSSFMEICTGGEGQVASITQPGGAQLSVSEVPCYVGLNRLQQTYESSRNFWPRHSKTAVNNLTSTDSTISHTDGSTTMLHAGKSGRVTAILAAPPPVPIGSANSSGTLPEQLSSLSSGLSAMSNKPAASTGHSRLSHLQPIPSNAAVEAPQKTSWSLPFSLPTRKAGSNFPPFPDMSTSMPPPIATEPAASQGTSSEAESSQGLPLEERGPSLFEAALQHSRVSQEQGLPSSQTYPPHLPSSLGAASATSSQAALEPRLNTSQKPVRSPFGQQGVQNEGSQELPTGTGRSDQPTQTRPSTNKRATEGHQPPVQAHTPEVDREGGLNEDWEEEERRLEEQLVLEEQEMERVAIAVPAEPFKPPKGRAPKSPFAPSEEEEEVEEPPGGSSPPRQYERKFRDSLKPVVSSYEPWPQLEEVQEQLSNMTADSTANADGRGEGREERDQSIPGSEPGRVSAAVGTSGREGEERGEGRRESSVQGGRSSLGDGQGGVGRRETVSTAVGTSDGEGRSEGSGPGELNGRKSSSVAGRGSGATAVYTPPVSVSPAVFSALSQLAPRIPELEEATNSTVRVESGGLKSGGKEEEVEAGEPATPQSPPAPIAVEMRSGLPVLLEQEGLIKRSDITFPLDEKGRPLALGRGGFGEVFKAYHLLEPVAVKRTYDQEKAREKLSRECAILKSLHSSYILQFIGACLEDDETLMVTELMDLSLFKALQNDRYTWFRGGRKVILDVARGLHYLHTMGIMHLDIKSANILLRKGDAKIADVGMAQIFANSFSNSVGVGTFAWVAPEVLVSAQNLLTVKVDIFSFGTLIWAVCTGEEPSSRFLRALEPEEGPPNIVDLINWCHSSDPAARPSAEQVVRWVESNTAAPERIRQTM